MDKKDYLVIYHREDNDGVFSAAILVDYLERVFNKSINDIELMGANYNDLSKLTLDDFEKWPEKYNYIAILDVSFDEYDKMHKLYELYKDRMIWCDHHAPVIQRMSKLSQMHGIRDINNSTIINVWRYLYDFMDEKWANREAPELYRILSAYDSWSYEREGYDFDYVRACNVAITNEYDLDVSKVLELVKTTQDDFENGKLNMGDEFAEMILEKGKAIIKLRDKDNENLLKEYGDFNWTVDDKKACVLFWQGSTNSTFFKWVKNNYPDIIRGVVFKRNNDSSWTISMYNIHDDDTFHCGEYLKNHYNGGGHKGAAGCNINENKFIELLHSHKL